MYEAQTHEEVAEIIKYTVPGVKVYLLAVQSEKKVSTLENSGQFFLELPRAKGFSLNTRDIYSLPMNVNNLRNRVKTLCETAVKCVKPLEINTKDYQ